MAATQKLRRGIQDIRTLSGAADEIARPHRAYMRVACLELEKFRRRQERDSAAARVRNIDGRFREIEAEQETILNSLAQGARPTVPPPAARAATGLSRAPGTGFRLKY